MTPETYTTSEVARIALVTQRQLQWWDETGILSPRQQSGNRVYQPRDLFAVLLFRELKQRGFSLGKVRELWSQMQEQGFALPGETQRWLLTDGKRAIFLEHSDVVLAFLEQRRNPAFVLISLSTIQDRMTATPLLPRRGPVSARISQPSGFTGREAKRA